MRGVALLRRLIAAAIMILLAFLGQAPGLMKPGWFSGVPGHLWERMTIVIPTGGPQ